MRCISAWRWMVGLVALCALPAAAEGEGEIPFDALACSNLTFYGQVVSLDDSAQAFSSDNNVGVFVFEKFFADEAITHLRWWGINARLGDDDCLIEAPTYNIGIRADDGTGAPGTEVFGAALIPTVTPTGQTFEGAAVYRLDVDLPEPVNLPTNVGHVVISASDNDFDCAFRWLTSNQGDASALAFDSFLGGYVPRNADMSLCVEVQSEDCAQEGQGRFRVQVFSPTFAVLSNATVTINSTITGVYDAEDGLFEFPCIPLGEYAINVETPQYRDTTVFSELTSPSQIVSVNLENRVEGDPCGDKDDKGCSTTTTLFISVLEEANNAPIKTATVSLPLLLQSTSENVAGVYVIPDLTDGFYQVRVEAPGFETQSRTVFVDDLGALNVVFKLDPVVEPFTHSADANHDGVLSLGDLLGIIQLYNAAQYHCVESGYAPGPGDQTCDPHSSDFRPGPGDFRIVMSELLRGIQLYAFQFYHACPGEETEDGYCTGSV